MTNDKNTLPVETDEDYGPAMRACLPKERALIVALFEGKNGAEAARIADYGNEDGSSTPETMARIAHRTLHRDRVQAAIAEYTPRAARALGPQAIQSLRTIMSNTTHKDLAKVSLAVVERIAPTVTRVDAHVTHEIVDHRQDALNQLRSLKALGVARERLEELFGFTGLPMLERQLAANETKQPIDAEFVEITPVDELDADIQRQMKDL